MATTIKEASSLNESPKMKKETNIAITWPLWLTLILLWAVIGLILVLSLKGNDCQFIYALDDSYIHLAIAKNLTRYGVWGLTPHEFASSSSS
jgi:hypothetical protein